jgi:hypothetical protein
MYTPTFRNPPELCSAVRELGAEKFLELLLDRYPWHRAHISNIKPEVRSQVIANLVEKIDRAIVVGGSVMMAALYSRFTGMAQIRSLNAPAGTRPVSNVDQFVISIARAIMLLDHGGPDAAQQVRTLSVDWDTLAQNAENIIKADPKFAGHMVVQKVCTATQADLAVRRLIEASIGRIATKESRKDIRWAYGLNFEFARDVVDWFRIAIRNNEPWLANVDEQNRPKKLLKFGSMEALQAEVEKQLARRLAKQRSLVLGPSDETMLVDGGDYHIKRLMTSRALEEESRSMRHCIGHGAYDDALYDDKCLLLSLRDKRGMPHATLDVRSGTVVQFRGKANSIPKEEYRAAVMSLMPKLQWQSDITTSGNDGMAA